MDKKLSGVSQTMSRFRGWIQAGATLLTNLHLPNFLKGGLYQGTGKTVCVPGLNCYSCPGAAGACPVGAFQAVVGSSKFRFSYYITGILILFGVLLGRFICGFLCPFGWFQELLHKIPSPKLSTKKLKPLRYLKYAVLLVMVVLLPFLAIIFLVCLIPTGMVSLGSITMAAAYPVLTLVYSLMRGLPTRDVVVCTVGAAIMGGMVIWMHRSNIQRIRDGKEYRFGQKHKSN